MQNANVKNGTA